MSKEVFYKQCRLVKRLEASIKETVTWIPEKFAVKGKYIKLKANDDEWEDGWLVRSVGDMKITNQHAERMHRQHRDHRKASDI